ncbi:MAG: hypothetical protein ALECFALPRED_004080 [Alectoria fallacina]|uniref:Uncharacterized protein n=1 Tax=Alectoria fallacina TaxID=1903189 RepID=A0A8H3IPG7_9LECA|nr:MAG: hypothetical protein ALECFALPRED_004080 [Alectoria fallacina]
MPADDYTAAISGGLKLKGVNSSGKVSKHHKKQRPKHSQPEFSVDASAEKSKDRAIDDGEHIKDEQEDATIDYRADLFIYLGRESALDKTSVKQRHMYITEANFSPNTSKAIPGG